MTLILVPLSACSPCEASPRLRTTVSSADIVVAADVASARRLLGKLGIPAVPNTIPLPAGVEEQDQMLAAANASDPSRAVVVLADHGAGIATLVTTAIDRQLPVTVVPGSDPIIAALAVSGLPSERFCFEGCPPRTRELRQARLAELASERRTMVFVLESGERAASIADLAAGFGTDRQAALCRGLAKTGDQVYRARLGELGCPVKEDDPELVLLVVAGATGQRPTPPPPASDLAAAVEELVRQGSLPKVAIAAVAERFKLRKRMVYDAVVEFKDRS